LYEDELRPLVCTIIAERDRLFAELGRIDGLSPVKSRANFIAVRSAINPRKVFDELLKRDILIRDVSSYPMLSDYFRVSVGTPEENGKLIAALRDIFKQE
jgi:histidinol-phosphate/aromatic aminotransferase/cobyric acid decarboxylase-like protein